MIVLKISPLFGLVPPQAHAIGRVMAGQAAQIYFESTVLRPFKKAGIGEHILTLKKTLHL